MVHVVRARWRLPTVKPKVFLAKQGARLINWCARRLDVASSCIASGFDLTRRGEKLFDVPIAFPKVPPYCHGQGGDRFAASTQAYVRKDFG